MVLEPVLVLVKVWVLELVPGPGPELVPGRVLELELGRVLELVFHRHIRE